MDNTAFINGLTMKRPVAYWLLKLRQWFSKLRRLTAESSCCGTDGARNAQENWAIRPDVAEFRAADGPISVVDPIYAAGCFLATGQF
jgi:hypothetical protein